MGLRSKIFRFSWFPTAFLNMCVTAKAVQRLGTIEGMSNKGNEVVFHKSSTESATGLLVYFGGDCQDYLENMNGHRDNHRYSKWNLESTCELLHHKFPTYDIYIIKPVHMHLKSFSCYKNFVSVNDFGAPHHDASTEGLQHLRLVLENASKKVVSLTKQVEESCQVTTNDQNSSTMCAESQPISLIGFSKGCVVLNQLLYSFTKLESNSDLELSKFVSRIKYMYWLDGGHSGSRNTWLTDKAVLGTFAQLNIKTRVHVTPHQVLCAQRPRIGKEEKVFRETLKKMGVDIERTLHFEDEPQSLETHFRVLEAFKP